MCYILDILHALPIEILTWHHYHWLFLSLLLFVPIITFLYIVWVVEIEVQISIALNQFLSSVPSPCSLNGDCGYGLLQWVPTFNLNFQPWRWYYLRWILLNFLQNDPIQLWDSWKVVIGSTLPGRCARVYNILIFSMHHFDELHSFKSVPYLKW